MNEREFEEFILQQVRRTHSIHAVSRWVYLLLAIAGVVIFLIGMAMHLSLSGGLPVLILSAGFLPASFVSKSAAASYAEAADEIAYGLEHPECNVPEDYLENTKIVRHAACCWAGAVIIAVVSEPGGPWFEPGLFALSLVMATIAVFLTVLTIKSIRDLPMAARYAYWLKKEAEREQDSDS